MYKPSLQISRFVVLKKNKTVFDEQFHNGVNIIRGDNGHGKSTVINLLVHGLGEERVNFNSSALQCSFTYVELKINGKTLTLRREISETALRPMAMFWGNYEDGIKSPDWELYPYKSTDKTISFSQVLFNLLGFPEVKTDLSSKLTMHQLLRLICKDQMAPVYRIFKAENFDSGDLREEIGGLLCGYNDDDLYTINSRMRDLLEEKKELSKKIEHIRSIFQEVEDIPDIQKIDKRLREIGEEREILCKKLQEEQKRVNPEENANEKIKQSEQIQNNLEEVNRKIKEVNSAINNIIFELQDSDDFIKYLKTNLKNLEESGEMQKVLGSIDIVICPACFSSLDSSDKNICQLCKNKIGSNTRDSNILKLKQQLIYQIKESTILQKIRDDKYEQNRKWLSKLASEQKKLQIELDNNLCPVSSQNTILETLNRQIGSLDKEVETLENKILLAQNIEKLVLRKSEISAEIPILEHKANNIRTNIDKKKKEACGMISDGILSLIKNDIDGGGKPYEADFGLAEKVLFSFDFDNISLILNNGEKHEVFAASSHVVLKDAFHFSMLIASCMKDFFRYPRFLIIDSIEDKGMQVERSQNIQKYMVEISDQMAIDHQIIFTTAKIADELNIPKYTIGKYYKGDIKSLAL